jgi:ATP-dependent 26S proteasome regulatory subunit
MAKSKPKTLQQDAPSPATEPASALSRPPKTPDWIRALNDKRRSNTSSIIIVETPDQGREREFVDWHLNRCLRCGKATEPFVEPTPEGGEAIKARCANCHAVQAGHLILPERYPTFHDGPGGTRRALSIYPERLVFLTPFHGLREYVVNPDGTVHDEPVKTSDGYDQDPTLRTIGITDSDLRVLHKHIVGDGTSSPEMLVREHRTVVIIRWPYGREDERLGSVAHLSDAIMDLALHNQILNVTRSTVIIFVGDRTGLKPEAINAANVVTPEPSSQAERARIIHRAIQDFNRKAPVDGLDPLAVADEEIFHVAEVLGGLNLDQTSMAICECLNSRLAIDMGFLSSAKANIISKAGHLRFEEKPSITFADIGGYEDVKEEILRSAINPLRHPDAVRFYQGAYKPSKGILLVGPPGTGKSLLGRAIANALDLSVAEIQADQFRNSLVGESERRTRLIWSTILAAEPVVVWIDEVEAILADRAKSPNLDSGVGRNIMSATLAYMDDPKRDRRSIFVMATNRPDDIDPAIKRPGRTDNIIYVGYPDETARRKVFEVVLTRHLRVPLASDIDIPSLATRTVGWSNAEIADACRNAVRKAAEEYIATGTPQPVSQAHLVASLSRDINIAKRIEEEERLITQIEPHVSDKTYLTRARENLARMKAATRKTPSSPSLSPGAGFIPGIPGQGPSKGRPIEEE